MNRRLLITSLLILLAAGHLQLAKANSYAFLNKAARDYREHPDEETASRLKAARWKAEAIDFSLYAIPVFLCGYVVFRIFNRGSRKPHVRPSP